MEKEVLILKSSIQMINNIVNRSVLTLHHSDPESEICAKTSTDQLYFNIILVDFLSSPDVLISDKKSSYLEALKKLCASPSFNFNNSIDPLKHAVSDFSAWLSKSVVINKMWFPNINIEIDLKIERSPSSIVKCNT